MRATCDLVLQVEISARLGRYLHIAHNLLSLTIISKSKTLVDRWRLLLGRVDVTFIRAGNDCILDAHTEGDFLGLAACWIVAARTFVIVSWVIGTVSLCAQLAKEGLITCLIDSLVNDGAMIT